MIAFFRDLSNINIYSFELPRYNTVSDVVITAPVFKWKVLFKSIDFSFNVVYPTSTYLAKLNNNIPNTKVIQVNFILVIFNDLKFT